jgi:MFS family permease
MCMHIRSLPVRRPTTVAANTEPMAGSAVAALDDRRLSDTGATAATSSYGWRIVAVSMVGLTCGHTAIVGSTFSMFLTSASAAMHASRAQVSLAYSLSILATVLCVLVVGRGIDRFGAKPVLVTCYTLMAAGLVSLWVFPIDRLPVYYASYILMGIGGAGANPLPYSRVISLWFDRRRGLALGLAAVGTGLGGFVMPFMAAALAQRLHWRAVEATLGVLCLVVVVPLITLALRERPEDVGLTIDGGAARASGPDVVVGMAPDTSSVLAQATFWKIAVAVVCMSSVAHGTVTNIVAIVAERGVPHSSAVLAASALGAGSLSGRLITGLLIDRYFAPYVGAAMFAIAAASIAAMGTLSAPAMLVATAGLVGVAWGAEVDLLSFLTSKYFAVGKFGRTYAYFITVHALGGVIGPYLFSSGFDRFGSYAVSTSAAALVSVAAAVTISSLGAYPRISRPA